MSSDDSDDATDATHDDAHDPERWVTFETVLDELLNDFVHTDDHADRAERILQERAQDMRELQNTTDHGRYR